MDYLSLCLICKDENDYLPEWLDYHILMGVERFYIYDNESRVGLRKTLAEYIERGWVVVVDIPGKAMQLQAYDHCLQTFGPNTFWLGFIDTDEFLVPKTTLDLKEFLKNYEPYGGLVVSSLFFGSNSHVERPDAGQIASYTLRTHATFKENELVKSIVQPARVLMPNSPHDFTYKENSWAVNENFLRAGNQRFPCYTEKIQLNHYYCRSESEIELKQRRGNSGAVVWSRKGFNKVNIMSAYPDTQCLQNLERLFQKAGLSTGGVLEKMAALAHARRPSLLDMVPPRMVLGVRAEFKELADIKDQIELVRSTSDYNQVCDLLLKMTPMQPGYADVYVDLAMNYMNIFDPDSAWRALSQAWRLAPNTYAVLTGMAYFFLWVKNFPMAEKTSRLLLDIAPHNLHALGLLTSALIEQERFDEALKIGVPVLELSAQLGELPARMSFFLVKKMSDHLLEKKDYQGAIFLWRAGVMCLPDDINPLLELASAMILAGDKTSAQQVLLQVQVLAPQNERLPVLLKQAAATDLRWTRGTHKRKRH